MSQRRGRRNDTSSTSKRGASVAAVPAVRPRAAATSHSAAVARSKARRDAPPAATPRFGERRGLRLIIVAVAVVFLVGSLLVASALSHNSNPGVSQVAGAVAWPAAPSGSTLSQRLSAAGLQLLNTEGETLHIHQQLTIYVNGQQVPVPADIGIDTSTSQLSPIHTHDDSGIIHVESPVVRTFTLGEFFQVWGVTLSSDCIGQFCASGTASLKTWVNGQPYSGDPSSMALAAHQVIVIAFGTPDQMPANIPSTYPWNGL